MKAMVAKEAGGPEVLDIREVEDPRPADQDVLIEVHATAMNPVDFKVRNTGLRGTRQFPLILGFDVSGVVREAGPAVEHLKPGDEVFASPSLARDGANAELVCVDARTAAHKPAGLSHEQAAALPLVTLTAWEALHKRARIHAGETVLIQAGAGGVGHIAIQLAKVAECRVITTASRDESIALCRELGADEVINYREQNVIETINELTEGRGCPVVFDTIGIDGVFEQSLDCVSLNGRMVNITGSSSERIGEALFTRNASLHYEFMGVPAMYGVNLNSHGEILRTVAELVDANRLKPHVSGTFALEDLPDVHRRQEQGHVTGKQVIKVRS